MKQHRPAPRVPVERTPDLFIVSAQSGPSQVSRAELAAYVEALENRCNTLWGYIQGYTCACDPVVRFLASDLGITVAHAGEREDGPAAD